MFIENIISMIASYFPSEEIKTSGAFPQEKSIYVSPSSSRSSMRRLKGFFAPPPTFQSRGCYVGELQEKWQFPSDHLPIGMHFDGRNYFSWNVLDAKYMNYVTEKNSQGLSRSLIVDEHVYLEGSNLTVRDVHVIDLLLKALSHPTHPKSFMALQESSEAFLKELKGKLPAHIRLIPSSSGEAMLIDLHQFEVLEEKEVFGLFSENSKKSVQEVLIKDKETGRVIRVLNGHLPGNPEKPARFEFAQYIQKTFDPSLTTIAMGDMNFNEDEMLEAFSQAFQEASFFSIFSPYCTNITPFTFYTKCIDHFMFFCPDSEKIKVHTAEEVMEGLSSIVELLENPK